MYKLTYHKLDALREVGQSGCHHAWGKVGEGSVGEGGEGDGREGEGERVSSLE